MIKKELKINSILIIYCNKYLIHSPICLAKGNVEEKELKRKERGTENLNSTKVQERERDCVRLSGAQLILVWYLSFFSLKGEMVGPSK